MLISHIYVLGGFGNFVVILGYIWGLTAFFIELMKFTEIGN